MFNRRTLFIIGAGASFEAGLPLGSDLAKIIAARLSVEIAQAGDKGTPNDPNLFEQIRRANSGSKFKNYQRAFETIRDGVLLSSSIDDFLNIHSQDRYIVEVGKAAIFRAILQAERGSRLNVDPDNKYSRPDYTKLDKTWFVKLMRVLGPGVPAAKVSSVLDNVAFIVFNYDRCVEHFLTIGLQQLYAIDRGAASKIVAAATIIHPYGHIGSLDSLEFGGSSVVDYDYVALSKSIKTYTEQMEEADTLKSIRHEVTKAKCIVFLGFAYHNQNMWLLKPSRPKTGKHIYGTAYDMSDADKSEVVEQLSTFFPDEPSAALVPFNTHIDIENKLTCAELFHCYAKSIAG